MTGRSSACTVIGGLPLGWPFDFALLPFDHCQRKISGDKPERLLTEKRYSPYRPGADIERIPTRTRLNYPQADV